MDNQEKERKEQEKKAKWHKFKTKLDTIELYFVLVFAGGLSLFAIIQSLLKDERTDYDYEQLLWASSMLILTIACWLFIKYECFGKLIDWGNRCYKEHNLKKCKKIHNLDAALSAMRGKGGLIAWYIVWGSGAMFFIICLLVPSDNGNNGVIISFALLNLLMLFGGHVLAPKIEKRKFYDKKLYEYSRMYIDYPSHEEYRMRIGQSIQRGVLSYTGFWMLTDEFMLGRLGDITFEPVAIPRDEIEKILFFYEKSYESPLLGILQLQLKNGKVVELCMGRGAQDMSEYTLRALQENGIAWTLEKMRYV